MVRTTIRACTRSSPTTPLLAPAAVRGRGSKLKRSSDSNLATSASKKPKQVETASFQSPINTQCSSSAPKDSRATLTTDNHRSNDANRSIPAPREQVEVAKDVKHSKKTVFQRACVTHFSHSHPLRPMEAKAEDELICSGCGLDLTGQAYKCSKSNCSFLLHRSCLNLDRVLQHDSHKQHALVLLSSPPKECTGLFVCSACNGDGTSFVYHCSDCKFDLHVGCALLPKTVEHVDHQIQNHYLQLRYSTPSNIEEVVCEVCEEDVPEEQWMYYCTKCQYCTHLHCTEEVEKEEEEEDDNDDDDSDDEVVEV